MRNRLSAVECVLAFLMLAFLMLAGACDVLGPQDGWHGWDCPEADTLFIDSHVTWDSHGGPVLLEQDVLVTGNGRLEIRPGTEIRFVENTVVICDPAGNMLRAPNIRVRGELLCEGRPDSLIVFTGSEYWGMGGEVSVIAQEARDANASFRWTHGLNSVRLYGGAPRIAHCVMGDVDINECSAASVDSNTIVTLSVLRGGSGVLKGNTFTGGVHTFSDSLLITGNVFAGARLSSNHDSHSLIVANTFEGCETALRIFSGSPELHGNNFSGNQRNILVLPELMNVENDTIDARHNWWGTVDYFEIAQSIQYEPNGDVYSEKVILWQPYALEPFDLTMDGWGQYGLHPN